MKIRALFSVLLLFSYSLFFAQQSIPKITATGIGTVSVFPNAAQITLSLKFVKPTLKEAITENKSATKNVLEVVKRFTTDTTGIKISLISTDKLTRWNQVQKKDVFIGFESAQSVIFTLNKLDDMQDFTEAIMKTKIYEIQKVSYFHTNGSNYIKQAQEKAVADAMDTTRRLAQAGGVTAGKIVTMSTTSSPEHGNRTRSESYRIETYSKQLEVVGGVTSSGELLTYTATVTLETEIK